MRRLPGRRMRRNSISQAVSNPSICVITENAEMKSTLLSAIGREGIDVFWKTRISGGKFWATQSTCMRLMSQPMTCFIGLW